MSPPSASKKENKTKFPEQKRQQYYQLRQQQLKYFNQQKQQQKQQEQEQNQHKSVYYHHASLRWLLFIWIFFITTIIIIPTTVSAQKPQTKFVEIGNNFTLECTTKTNNITWLHKNATIGSNASFSTVVANSSETVIETPITYIHTLTLRNVKRNDEGSYICMSNDERQEFLLQTIKTPRIVRGNAPKVKQKIGHAVTLYCLIEAYPLNVTLQQQIKWLKDDTSTFKFLDDLATRTQINATHLNLTLEFNEVYNKENGSYACVIYAMGGQRELSRRNMVLLVMDVPKVSIDYVKAVGAHKIYLNWTVNDGNDPIQKYFIQHSQEGAPTFTYYKDVIGGQNTSYVLDNFAANTSYLLRLSAKNSIGDGIPHAYHMPVRTLAADPIFVPRVETTGSTASTITIGWNPPPPELLEYVQYYELVVSEAGETPRVIEESIYAQNSRNLPYMFDNLKTATAYEFKVRACSELTKLCGPWSEVVNGTTMDGVASQPTQLVVNCVQYNNTMGSATRSRSVLVSWQPPATPNGKVVSYLIQLDGISMYRRDNQLVNETWGPKMRRVDEPLHKTIYDNVQANTNYTITVAAITRHRKTGETAVAHCQMPADVPKSISRIMWTKVKTTSVILPPANSQVNVGSDEEGNSCVLKLFLPKISERNGPICCYRLYLVRMGNTNFELPPPEQLYISTYQDVHAFNNSQGGAYLAEMFSGSHFRSEVFLGDGKRFFEHYADVTNGNNHNNPNANNEALRYDTECRKCLAGKPFLKRLPAIVVTATPNTPTLINNIIDANGNASMGTDVPSSVEPKDRAGNLTAAASKILDKKRRRRRRHPKAIIDHNVQQALVDTNNLESSDNPVKTTKSQNLLIDNNHQNAILTDFVEIIDGPIDINSNYTGFLEVIVRDKNIVMMAYSNYFEIITPGTEAEHYLTMDDVSVMMNILIQVLAIPLGVVFVLLIIMCFIHRYNTKNSASGDEVISLRDSLSRALFGGRSANHHRHFIGTTNPKASDIAPIHKNDLYIAYKNRHKDTDYGFLREYEMLPNRFNDRTTKNSDMKENSLKNRYPDIKAYDQTRVKLSQINGIQGSDYINANFVIGYKERKKFICAQGPMESTISDFWRMIWEHHLEIIVMLTNLEEYNKSKCAKYWPEKILDIKQYGEITVKFVAEKKLGDYLIRTLDVYRRMANAAATDDIISGNGIGGAGDEERRQITQYHYLAWKDFMAPEHPHGIIKFIRHINAVYSLQRGPILVHCSAGVGRTGTLVALDSLMQQLEEEQQVSIFNTVCDLRHQRNFLVQSLKQYIFLYRALLDSSHFGNTELSANNLSATVERLKTKPNDGKDKCKLEMEFEKLLLVSDETNKTCSVASNEENVCKNRSDSVLPYDRNRVILAPIPMKDNSTYINASFIEGYDSNQTFIITQDPLENTISDFWRMVSEQSISTLVMISEIGDGPRKCPRYWADDAIQYDHIMVKYMQSESCPYYTRREFHVINCKNDDTLKVTQFQYNGWPTVDGEVPEVCRGIIELVDQALSHYKQTTMGCRTALTVHCSLGTDRSSIFVAMCILVQQLRAEKIIDICNTARKIRSQRPMLLNTYAQYEFLHRAIANYADLHGLSAESPTSESS